MIFFLRRSGRETFNHEGHEMLERFYSTELLRHLTIPECVVCYSLLSLCVFDDFLHFRMRECVVVGLDGSVNHLHARRHLPLTRHQHVTGHLNWKTMKFQVV